MRWHRAQHADGRPNRWAYRSDPPGWAVSLAASAPDVPLPGPPRPGHGQSCPWRRLPGPPRMTWTAWRLPHPDARTPDGRRPMARHLGAYARPELARAACLADAAALAAGGADGAV